MMFDARVKHLRGLPEGRALIGSTYRYILFKKEFISSVFKAFC
jgi:hypothetical protein